MSFLYGINSPKDLKKLRIEDLPFLAQELRENIIDVCAKNGGHLGGSLGAVDLIVALHYCFNMPEDKIVWDVGHQAYAHKALTGRKERLSTIRLTDGLSGFPKRDESPYDTYGTAHASTGISAALGIKAAKDLKGEKDFVVVVVGDGGLTGGMAYEGLNQCGHLKKNLIIILNDNGMSISENVGAITQFLTKRASSSAYIRARKEIKHLLDLLSEYGVPLLNPIEKIRTSLKSLFSSGIFSGIFFESLGLRYLGPFDGHDIPTLVDTFKHIPTQLHSHPILIHLITKKGKGYPMAEANPVTYHGVSPFDPETGKTLPVKAGPPSYTSVFANTLIKVAKENPKIIGITAAMPEGTGLDKFAAEFPNRYFMSELRNSMQSFSRQGLQQRG
jgi:1-deoxy-D-xylulose-5-phosphate synthase